MKLWILRLNDCNWGTMMGIVVRAKDEQAARKLASTRAYGEGGSVWLDKKHTSCQMLSNDGNEEVILRQTAD